MQRVISHSAPREMVLLGMAEAVLSFGAVYSMAQGAGTLMWPAGLEIRSPVDSFMLAAALAFVTGIIGLVLGLYRPEAFLDWKRLFLSTALASVLISTVLLASSGALRSGAATQNVLAVAKALGLWLAAMMAVRLAYGLAVIRLPIARRILFLADTGRAGAVNTRLRSLRVRGVEPVAPHAPTLSWAALRRHRVAAVVVGSGLDGTAMESLLDCKLRGMPILTVAAFHERYLGRIDLGTLVINDLLVADGFGAGRTAAVLKRACDLGIAVSMLLLGLPLMVLTALAIKIDSPGHVFHRQQRIGQFDQPFTVFKFRSMRTDAEANGGPRWAQKQVTRATRVGRFIRATRIDELPQLVNVIRGEMSLVGPRPERPHFVEQLALAVPFYQQRTYVKPGLTGWAQVRFPYGASVEDAREKLAYDLYYVKHRSIALDVAILMSTIRVVLSLEGAR